LLRVASQALSYALGLGSAACRLRNIDVVHTSPAGPPETRHKVAALRRPVQSSARETTCSRRASSG